MKKICVCSHKGGVGKTAISYNIALLCNLLGYKTLIIDNDSQHNISSAFMINNSKYELINVFNDDYYSIQIDELILETGFKNIHLITNSTKIDFGLNNNDSSVESFKDFISILKYDVVLFDCSPGFSIQNKASFSVCDLFLLPTNLNLFALSSLYELVSYIRQNYPFSDKLIIPNNIDCYYSGKIKKKVDIESLNNVYDIFDGIVFDKLIPKDPYIEYSFLTNLNIFNDFYNKSNSKQFFVELFCDIFNLNKNDVFIQIRKAKNGKKN